MPKTPGPVDSITRWVGSPTSLVAHTLAFLLAFILGAVHLLAWDDVFLMLTTVVSLEAIYLAIFIQMSINQNTESLREVEVDVDEIQKDIDAIEQDVDEIQEDNTEEERRDAQHKQVLESISNRLHQLLEDVDALQKSTT